MGKYLRPYNVLVHSLPCHPALLRTGGEGVQQDVGNLQTQQPLCIGVLQTDDGG